MRRRVVFLLPIVLAGFSRAALAQVATYTVTVTQPSHGTISPSGAVSVANDPLHPTTFTITPDPGYTVADVYTAGASHGGVTSFTCYGIWYNTTLGAKIIPTPNSTPETIYVDNQLTANITDGTYSIANRSGGGSDGNAYKSIGGACDVAGPGDTVYLRGGNYSSASPLPGDVVWPRVSGTAANPILIKSYPGEKAAIVGNDAGSYPIDLYLSISRCPISMRNVSYITVDGLTIDGTAGWGWIGYCHHITIQNCMFRNSTWDSKGTFRFHFSSYCILKDCTFVNSAYDATLLMNSDHIVVDGCTWLGTFVHTNLSLRSASWCVIRNNSFRNGLWTGTTGEKLTEVFDQKLDLTNPLGPSFTPVPGYNGTQHNLFENNWFGYHPDATREYNVGSRCSAIQFSGQKTIIRRNVFSNPTLATPDPNGGTAGGVGIVWRWGGSWDGFTWNGNSLVQAGSTQAAEAGFVWGNRVYHNVFYGYDMGQMTFPVNSSIDTAMNPPPMRNVENYQDYPFSESYRFNDNKIVNNIFAGCVIYYRRNLTYIVQSEGQPVQMFVNGRRDVTYWLGNNYWDSAGTATPDALIHDQVDYPYQTARAPAWYNTQLPTNFIGNLQVDPCFASLPVGTGRPHDGTFILRAESSCIDAGRYLTTITSETGQGAQFTVADPNYFYDGYGISGEQGDLIKLSNGQTARITSINYSNGTMTLDRVISWGNGEKVSLAYEGTAPDIGAFEYTIRPISDLAVSGTSQNSLTLGWTIPGADGSSDRSGRYDIRYAASAITEANWETATPVQGEPEPGDVGDSQSFTISGLNPGTTYYIGIKTSNTGGTTISDLSNIASAATASGGNRAPVFQAIGDKAVAENATLTFTVGATDADGDTLTYSASGLPTGASFTPATRVFTWTPTNTQGGTHWVTFGVTDGQIPVTQTIAITVAEVVNNAPVLAAIGNKNVNEGSLLSFSVSATDSDGHSLTYSATGLPSGANFTGQAFTWVPTYEQAGTYSVTFTVTDGELTDSEPITITVANVTPDLTAPTAAASYPAADAIQVPVNPVIGLTVSDAGQGVDAGTVTIRVNDQLVYSGNAASYQSVYGVCRRTGTQASYRYAYQPAEAFRFDQQVSVRVTASDLAGNAMTPYNCSFTTEMRVFGDNRPASWAPDDADKTSPATVCDSAGNIWLAYHAGAAGQRDIYVSKLTLGNANFAGPIQLTTDSSDQCFPAIAIGSDDTLYVVWQDRRRGNWDIYIRTSGDGLTWSAETRITDSDDNQIRPAIAVDSQSPNRAWVAWQDDGAGNQDIYVATSSNAFSTKTISQVTTNASDQTDPAIAVDASNTAYLVWADGRNGTSDVYGAASNSGPWTNVAVATGTGSQSAPVIATEAAGTVLHFAWVDDTGTDATIRCASSDGMPGSPLAGANIVDDTSGADQMAPSIATVGSAGEGLQVFLCWTDERNVNANGRDTDLYFVDVSAGQGTNVLVGDGGTGSDQSEPAVGVDRYGYPYVLWTDSRNVAKYVYYAGSTYMAPDLLESELVTAATGRTIGVVPPTSLNDVSVVIPAGVCPHDVTITIARLLNPQSILSSNVLAFDFGPSGLQFNQPVTVTIPYPAADYSGGTPVPCWYVSQTGTLSQQDITDVQILDLSDTLKALRFRTTHFTSYYLLESFVDDDGDGTWDGDDGGDSGGGGGGGCALSPGGGGGAAEFLLPYLGLAAAVIAWRLRDRKARNIQGR